jgi:iron-sulfur cluster repair protein YtfE (RIC family)
MLRDKALIPLSHQHQRALALCVRIDRAQPIRAADLDPWQSEIQQQFQQEVQFHFAAEEGILFPVAKTFPELVPLVEELISDHGRLRASFAQAGSRQMNAENLVGFAQEFSAHIRKEERQLFEGLQLLLKPEEMIRLGAKLESALKNAAASCAIPNEATKLKPK